MNEGQNRVKKYKAKLHMKSDVSCAKWSGEMLKKCAHKSLKMQAQGSVQELNLCKN